MGGITDYYKNMKWEIASQTSDWLLLCEKEEEEKKTVKAMSQRTMEISQHGIVYVI